MREDPPHHQLHHQLAASHPKLARGQVWCRSCGATRNVDPAAALAEGWPKCCGYTTTIDAPGEAADRDAKAQLDV